MAPTHHQTTPHASDAPCMHDAMYLDTLPSVLVFMVTYGEHGGAKSSWAVRVRRRAKSIFAHVHMSGHYMAPKHHQTTPDPSNTLYMHAATCLDAFSGR